MSKNAKILEKAALSARRPKSEARPNAEIVGRSRAYEDLCRGLFQSCSAVAIVGSGSITGVTGVCEGIATELAASGNRVIVVSVENLLRMSRKMISDDTAFSPAGNVPNVWLWPSTTGQRKELFKSRATEIEGHWLDSLRKNFDSVLLDCPPVDATSGVADVVAMADAAVLVVEAGHTPRHQIINDQNALKVRGANLVGCILMQRR
jgi:hypothetical protein